MPSLRDRAVRVVYRLGWSGAARLPDPVQRVMAAAGARLAVRHDGHHVRTLRQNLAIATGEPTTDARALAALASYLRTFLEVLSLSCWPPERALTGVRLVNERVVRDAMRDTGAVIALPHSGNWDLAGAWACGTGMFVSTVAEELRGPDFAAFRAFREGLGMEVIGHRDKTAIPRLVAAARAGRLVCLIADRDLSGGGVRVRWRGTEVTMPGGPALVARRSGAALIPAVCHYDGPTMVLTLGDRVPHQPGTDGLVAMTQQVADFFAARIAHHPADWHMLQPFFRRSA